VKNDVEALAAGRRGLRMDAVKKRKIAIVSDAINRPGPGLWTPWKNWRGNFIPNYLRRKIDAAR